ncbi:MAG: hypothetical protein LUE93_07595 [Bacteroides sp.]|nr:hypothetical protein [Bacteroides sp.]
MMPAVNGSYDLGSSTQSWRNIYAASLGVSATPIGNGYFTNLSVGGTPVTPNNYVKLTEAQTVGGVKTFTSTAYFSDGIGGTSYPVPNAYISNLGATSAPVTQSVTTNAVVSSLSPLNNTTSTVGSSTTPFPNGYFTNLQKGGVDVATVDDLSSGVSNMVTTDTAQIISGAKTFTDRTVIQNTGIVPSSNGTSYIGDANYRFNSIYAVNIGSIDPITKYGHF